MNSKSNLFHRKNSFKEQLLAIASKKSYNCKSQGNTKVCTPINILNQEHFLSNQSIKTSHKIPADTSTAEYSKFMDEYVSEKKRKKSSKLKSSGEKRVKRKGESRDNPYY